MEVDSDVAMEDDTTQVQVQVQVQMPVQIEDPVEQAQLDALFAWAEPTPPEREYMMGT